MLRTIRDRLTYANVMSTLAVFIALGGSSYAALKVGSKEINDGAVRSVDLRNNDVRGKDVRNGTLTGRDVKPNGIAGGSINESRLGKVPSAAGADRVGGRTADELRVRCPAGTILKVGVCFEARPSAPASFGAAGDDCSARGRLLPSYAQLNELIDDNQVPLASGGELTSSIFFEGLQARVVTVATQVWNAGASEFRPV